MKKKILVLFLGVFLLTGCNAEYNIEIIDNEIKINGSLVETNSSNWEKAAVINQEEEIDHNADPNYCTGNSCSIIDGEVDTSSLTFSEIIDLKTTNWDTKVEGLEKIKTNTKLGIKLERNLSYQNTNTALKQVPGIKDCYKYFSIVDNQAGNGVILSTSNKNLCFEQYPLLEEITITLKTNHKVEEHNADETVDGKYIWKINKNNYSNKSIQINLLDETEKKLDLSLFILLVSVILLVVFIGGPIFIKTYIKSKKVDIIK